MTRSKRIGTAAESQVAQYLRDHGFVHAERRALRGAYDTGDITGLGPGVVIEVKRQHRLELAEWLDETEDERVNAAADVAVCVHKRWGRGNVGEWYCTMTVAQFVDLLKEYVGLTRWPLTEQMSGTYPHAKDLRGLERSTGGANEVL